MISQANSYRGGNSRCIGGQSNLHLATLIGHVYYIPSTSTRSANPDEEIGTPQFRTNVQEHTYSFLGKRMGFQKYLEHGSTELTSEAEHYYGEHKWV
eukprot:6206880-Pleurochrysis_carterae.AAC.5